MITFFTTPKPMAGHDGLTQRNALRSWARLDGCEVIVFGGDETAAALCRDEGLHHEPIPATNAYGTPLLSGLYERAEAVARRPMVCYINADIVLLPGFLDAARTAASSRRRFLMVGRRTDLAVGEPMGFEDGWHERLAQRAGREGRVQGPTAIDYFLTPRGTFGRLPAFAIGRTAWDNWLIYHARRLKVPVVDATDVVLAVHQDHDYEHTGRAAHGRGRKWVWQGPEAKQNLAMAGGKRNLFTLWDATHRLTRRGVVQRETGQGLGGGVWSYRRSAGHGMVA